MVDASVRGVRVGGRSERVVADVLHATIAELGRVGYAALRFDDVAASAGVNKTTIYRRWPTKATLVEAALRAWRQPVGVPDTGSIDGDLYALGSELAGRATTTEKRCLTRVFNTELEHPEVAAIARTLRAESRAQWREVLDRAIARGQLPHGTDANVIVDLVWGALLTRIRLDESVDRVWLQSLVHVVLEGVRATTGT
jgi:AcrR family transcriptional regulator